MLSAVIVWILVILCVKLYKQYGCPLLASTRMNWDIYSVILDLYKEQNCMMVIQALQSCKNSKVLSPWCISKFYWYLSQIIWKTTGCLFWKSVFIAHDILAIQYRNPFPVDCMTNINFVSSFHYIKTKHVCIKYQFCVAVISYLLE